MSSLITFTRYKYGIKRCGFPCDHLVQFTPRVQDYQKVLPKSLHSDMPEGWWKGRNTYRYLLPEDANQVLWILGSLITPFAGSLPSPKVPHSTKIRVKIVGADAHPTSRASPCAWHRWVRTGFLSKGPAGEQDLFDFGANSTEYWLP